MNATAPAPQAWRGFTGTAWRDTIDVRRLHPAQLHAVHRGRGASWPDRRPAPRGSGPRCSEMFVEERQRGIYDVDAATPSTITSHAPGYIDRDRELIVGLQTDAPLRRAIMPNGGLRMVEAALKAYGYELDPDVTADLHHVPQDPQRRGLRRVPGRRARGPALAHHHRAARRVRPRPDHRRLPAGGAVRRGPADRGQAGREGRAGRRRRRTESTSIRDREELAEQIRALGELKEMAAATATTSPARPAPAARRSSGCTSPTWPPTKEQNGAAMSLGRTSTFLDVYLQRDLAEGTLTEERAQELIDDFVIKLRIIRFLRTPEYDAAVLRRPDLGHRGARRHRRGRPAAGDPDQLPVPADALQPRPGAGAEPDRAVVAGAAGGLQAVLRPGVAGHQRDPVRERRPDPARVQRRHRDRLLRVGACGSARTCSSSAPGPTWPRRCCTPSTAAGTRSPATRSPRPARR